MAKKLLITLCGRAGSKGFKNKNLKTFCGKPLSHYTLSAIDLFVKARPDVEVDVVLNTDSGLLREVVCNVYPEVIFVHRPAALAGDTVAKMEVFQHSLQVMEEKRGCQYDYLMDLDITSPLRTLADVLGCFAAKEARDDLDLVTTVAKSRRSPYMNMAKRVEDHVEQVIKTSFTARQQTPECYDLNASIYAFKRDFLKTNTTGFLWDGKLDVYEMMDTGVLDIDSEEDFDLMEIIAGYLFRSNPGFAQIRDNIR
ncbi:acylneuraminate cytidylyltransferase family protein [Ruminococcaceae bacterium OttesenSCG-928-A16]|nr:acylneuraminate cytidylyltransferase family protein [Ruminococcaceae bacterium OttesenSCG-928-A16]